MPLQAILAAAMWLDTERGIDGLCKGATPNPICRTEGMRVKVYKWTELRANRLH